MIPPLNPTPGPAFTPDLLLALREFKDFDQETRILPFPTAGHEIPVCVNEFWTSKQRAAHSLHEVSYRACFKPQLPRFFIERLTRPGDSVHDPFMGRGTTLVEAALLGRVPSGCDINPLSRILVGPRLAPPSPEAIEACLETLDLDASPREIRRDLEAFYHQETLRQLCRLREHWLDHDPDPAEAWLRMVATNRLTGHSPGFFSVYSMPPNQAVSIASQLKINAKRNQTPPPRDVRKILLKKSRQLLKDLTPAEVDRLGEVNPAVRLVTGSCESTPEIPDNSIHLVVTSPPFLNAVNYQQDNWLRCWFNGLDAGAIPIWQIRTPEAWQQKMTLVFHDLKRMVVPGGHIAFEVGELRKGTLLMETLVVPAAIEAGLTPVLVLINDQNFTKTANCWGVSNQTQGTNTNRVVVLRKTA